MTGTLPAPQMSAPIPESGNAPEGVFSPPMAEDALPIDLLPPQTDPPPVDISSPMEVAP